MSSTDDDDRRQEADEERVIQDREHRDKLGHLLQSQNEHWESAARAIESLDRTFREEQNERRDFSKLIKVLTVLIFFGVTLLLVSQFQAFWQRTNQGKVLESTRELSKEIKALGLQIEDCVGENPNTDCRKRGQAQTGAAIAQLQFASECVALYAKDKKPEVCRPVIDRLQALERGENPFPTTTVPHVSPGDS